jgi:metal-dependent amidase/aminoacylase/carboxypeptidase family protein
MDEFVNLHRELHANPELSGDERQTASRIESLFRQIHPAWPCPISFNAYVGEPGQA